MRRCSWMIPLAVLLAVGWAAPGALAAPSESTNKAPAASETKAAALAPQTACPIMGGKVNKGLYADVAGYRIYVCCAGCLDAVKADPGN